MKKLTKIKLVNWHLFANETVEIQDNAILSGENGSGKSTLLDAIQYLLVGGRGGVKFNVAANEDAKRSLEGYVRGRLGAEDREFLRPNDVITHVALEFYDEEDDTYNILGVILDLPKGANIKERFYILEDISIDDALFLDGNYPRDYRSMRAFLKTMGRELRPYDTQKAYRDAMSRFFGMDARKYSQILPKALAFKPIDLQAFIFEFLLDDDPVDIRSLKNNVEQLKKVEMQIIKDREKLTKLDAINDIGDEITSNRNQMIVSEIIHQLNYIEQRENIILSNEKEEVKLEQRLTNLREEKKKIDVSLEEADAQIAKLESLRSEDDIERTLQHYQEQFNKQKIEYDNAKETLANLNETLLNEFNILKEILNKHQSHAFKDFVSYYQQNQSKLNSIELSNLLANVAGDQTAFLEAFNIEKERNERARQEISSEIYQINGRINALKRNVKTYPQTMTDLQNVLNETLSNHFGHDIKVMPLAELIEVKNEK